MSEKELKLPVLNYQGSKVGEIVLPSDLFGAEVNEYAVQRAVKTYLSNCRVATAKTKDRSEVHGTNRKPYRQKHTGRARAGTTSSPIWRHGGVVHGPNGQQSYKLKMNKKEHYVAFVSALSDKANSDSIIILTKEPFNSMKTKDFKKTLVALKADEKKNLIVISNYDENLIKACRNLSNVSITTADNLSVYDILDTNKLIMLEDTIPACEDEKEN